MPCCQGRNRETLVPGYRDRLLQVADLNLLPEGSRSMERSVLLMIEPGWLPGWHYHDHKVDGKQALAPFSEPFCL